MLVSEIVQNKIKSLPKHELKKGFKHLNKVEYDQIREIWMDTETFTDFANLVQNRGFPTSQQDLYLMKTFFEMYHNIGGEKHYLIDM